MRPDEDLVPVDTYIRLVHVVGPLGAAVCPECGDKHEDEGGSVRSAGSWDWGPFYWTCDCGAQWGHA